MTNLWKSVMVGHLWRDWPFTKTAQLHRRVTPRLGGTKEELKQTERPEVIKKTAGDNYFTYNNWASEGKKRPEANGHWPCFSLKDQIIGRMGRRLLLACLTPQPPQGFSLREAWCSIQGTHVHQAVLDAQAPAPKGPAEAKAEEVTETTYGHTATHSSAHKATTQWGLEFSIQLKPWAPFGSQTLLPMALGMA